jgi:hypothetical protein
MVNVTVVELVVFYRLLLHYSLDSRERLPFTLQKKRLFRLPHVAKWKHYGPRERSRL